MRRIATTFVMAAAIAWPASIIGQSVPLTVASLEVKALAAEATKHRGRDAIRLIDANKSGAESIALVTGVTFGDGTIEVDVAGRRGPHAAPEARGFIGLAFRVTPGGDRYECFYLRPENGRANDQVRRNHSTQYVSHPEFPWPRLRKEFPERYESYVDLEPDVWTKMRVVVAGTTAQLFVHDAPQPVLVVNDLKLGASKGGVGLWIGAGTEGFFSNLRVKAGAP